jgi:hypothetical protein
MKRGLGLVALASIVSACAANGEKPTSDERTSMTSEALGEMACTQIGTTVPFSDPIGKLQVMPTPTYGCSIDTQLIPPDSPSGYGIPGCPHQYLWELTNITGTSNNPIQVIPHHPVSEFDCPNTTVSLGAYGKDSQGNWTLLKTGSANGTWDSTSICNFPKTLLSLPATASTSLLLASSAYTVVLGKGGAGQEFILHYIHVTSACW